METSGGAPEHRWLMGLVGEWEYETTCQMGPDQAPMELKGRQITRGLGPFWTIGEMTASSPGSDGVDSVITLGYDPVRQRFVGTFVVSCLPHLWLYDGLLDSTGRELTLDTEGPNFMAEGERAPYQDIVTLVDSDQYRFSSRLRLPSGEWMLFMQSTYRRIRS